MPAEDSDGKNAKEKSTAWPGLAPLKILSDADFTPNPDRSISIDGNFTEALLERLRPEILELTAQNREPITIYIDSEGGSPDVGQRILDLLKIDESGQPESLPAYHRRRLESAKRSRGSSFSRRFCDRNPGDHAAVPWRPDSEARFTWSQGS